MGTHITGAPKCATCSYCECVICSLNSGSNQFATVQRNELEERCEFYLEDSERLRQKLNEPPVAAEREVWQRRRQSKMAQLEAVNAELECMVSDLEEERRRGRESLKLCARYHGKCAFLVFLLACSVSLFC
jgi:hypothetical protein